MSDDPKLTKDQFVRILKDAHTQELTDEAEAMTDEEVEARMKASPVSEAAAKASLDKQRKLFEQAASRQAQKAEPKKEAKSNVVDIRTARRWWALPATAAGSIAAAAALIMVLGRTDNLPSAFLPPKPIPTTTAALPPITDEQYYRWMAMSELHHHNYQGCLNYLDKAKALDEYGETAGDVQEVRKLATEGLARERDR